MLPLLLRQDGKKGGKKERFCHRIWHASTADPGTDFAALECAAWDHSHFQVQEPGAPGGEYAVFDFAPEGEDMAALGGMHQNRRTSHDPLTFDF